MSKAKTRIAGCGIFLLGSFFIVVAIYGYAAHGDKEIILSVAAPAGLLLGLGAAIAAHGDLM